jgi:hypothetical protein
METTSLRVEDRLDGASKFLSWKSRVTFYLNEYDFWAIVEKVAPPPIDPQDFLAHEKKEIKAQGVILDAMKDRLIPHLSKKKMDKEIFDALVGLFQNDNMNRKMLLRNKLRSVQISRYENVTNYFMRITRICDQLAAIGEKLDDVEFINVALNGFSKSLEPFFKGVCTREKLPYWQRIWDDFIHEDTWEESKGNKQGSSDVNLALVSNTRKGKGKGSNKKGNSDGGTSQPGKKKDLSKIKSFACHKNGHYSSQCPNI